MLGVALVHLDYTIDCGLLIFFCNKKHQNTQNKTLNSTCATFSPFFPLNLQLCITRIYHLSLLICFYTRLVCSVETLPAVQLKSPRIYVTVVCSRVTNRRIFILVAFVFHTASSLQTVFNRISMNYHLF